MALFGFAHDEHLLARMGEPWAGVAAAERLLLSEAEAAGTTLAELRRERMRKYDRFVAAQTADLGHGG